MSRFEENTKVAKPIFNKYGPKKGAPEYLEVDENEEIEMLTKRIIAEAPAPGSQLRRYLLSRLSLSHIITEVVTSMLSHRVDSTWTDVYTDTLISNYQQRNSPQQLVQIKSIV